MFGEIRNSRNEKLDYTYHPGHASDQRLVVIGHGVTGNKDRPFVVALAEALSKAGIPSLRFSFAGNGSSEGKFTDCTISKEVEDLGSVLDALTGRQIIYVGHSMGGAVGVLRTSQDPRIKQLISLAGMVYTRAFAQREFGQVAPGQGFMWDDEKCPLSQTYMDDMARIDAVLPKASNIKVPWLLIHGTEDDVVPLQDSLDIFKAANQPKELFQIQGANHVFAGEHLGTMTGKVVSYLTSPGKTG